MNSIRLAKPFIVARHLGKSLGPNPNFETETIARKLEFNDMFSLFLSFFFYLERKKIIENNVKSKVDLIRINVSIYGSNE